MSQAIHLHLQAMLRSRASLRTSAATKAFTKNRATTIATMNQRRYFTSLLNCTSHHLQSHRWSSNDTILNGTSHHINQQHIRMNGAVVLEQTRYLSGNSSQNSRQFRQTSSRPNAASQRKMNRQPTRDHNKKPSWNGQRLLKKNSWNISDWESAHTIAKSEGDFRLLNRMVQEVTNVPATATDKSSANNHDNANEFYTFGMLSTDLLNQVLAQYAQHNVHKQFDASKVAHNILDVYPARFQNSPQNPLLPDCQTYQLLMESIIQQDPHHAPQRCQRLLEHMKRALQKTDSNIHATLIKAYLMSGQPNAIQKSEISWDHMLKNESQPAVSKEALVSILDGWIRFQAPSTDASSTMRKPNTSSPTIDRAMRTIRKYLDYAANNGDGSLDFLNDVLKRCQRDHAVDPVWTLPLIDAIVTDVSASVTAETYASLILLWSRASPEAPERAEYWLEQMKTAASNQRFLPPRSSLYTAVIAAWEKSNDSDAPYRAEAIWTEMIAKRRFEQIPPGAHYLLLSLWSKSKLIEGPEKAEELLEYMMEESKINPNVIPSSVAFVNVMKAWRNHDQHTDHAAYRVQALLDQLIQHHINHPGKIALNDVPFNVAISAWGQSGDPETVGRIQAILADMERLSSDNKLPNLQPTIVTAWSTLEAMTRYQTSSNVTALPLEDITKLLKYVDNRCENKNKSLKAKSYKCVLSFWVQSGRADAPKKMELILKQMVQSIQKDGMSFDAAMLVLSYMIPFCQDPANHQKFTPAMIQSLLQTMNAEVQKHSEISTGMEQAALFIPLMAGWSKSGHAKADQVMEKLHHQIRHAFEANLESKMHHNASIEIIKKMMGFGLLKEADDLVSILLKKFESKNRLEVFALDAYEDVIQNATKSGRYGSLDQAYDVLALMLKEVHQNGAVVQSGCFAQIIEAAAMQGREDIIDAVWKEMIRLQSDDLPGKIVFEPSIVEALAHGSTDRAMLMAMALHLTLNQDNKSSWEGKLRESHFHIVLDALVKSSDEKTGQVSETVMLRMQEYSENGHFGHPNFSAFEKVLRCWSTSGMKHAAARAEGILKLAENLYSTGDEALQPSANGYMDVIACLSQSYEVDAVERIKSLRQRMIDTLGHKVGDNSYESVEVCMALLTAYANSGKADAYKHAKKDFSKIPKEYRDTELYNALIKTCGSDAHQAEAVLQEMQQRYLQGVTSVEPNTTSFNSVLMAWCQSGSPMAGWRADSIFNQMIELDKTTELNVKPNTETFDLVVTALANSMGPKAIDKIEKYLKMLKDNYRSGDSDSYPGEKSYTAAIRCLGLLHDDSGSISRAQALLGEMHQLAKEGVDTARPTVETYEAFLKAVASSSLPNKAEIAHEVRKMLQFYHVESHQDVVTQLQRCLLPDEIPEQRWTVTIDKQGQSEFPVKPPPKLAIILNKL